MQDDDEAKVIAAMREIAEKYHLTHEVMQAYKNFREAGDSPEVAASCALYEWDI